MIVAFDFDDTLFVKNIDQSIGEPISEVISVLKKLKERGDKIIVFSGRSTEEIREHLDRLGIPYDYVNEEAFSEEAKDIPKTESNKPYYDVLVDDRSVNPKGLSEKELLEDIDRIGEVSVETERKESGEKQKIEKLPYDEFEFLVRLV